MLGSLARDRGDDIISVIRDQLQTENPEDSKEQHNIFVVDIGVMSVNC